MIYNNKLNVNPDTVVFWDIKVPETAVLQLCTCYICWLIQMSPRSAIRCWAAEGETPAIGMNYGFLPHF